MQIVLRFPECKDGLRGWQIAVYLQDIKITIDMNDVRRNAGLWNTDNLRQINTCH